LREGPKVSFSCLGCKYLLKSDRSDVQQVSLRDKKTTYVFKNEVYDCLKSKREIGGTASVTPDWCDFKILYDGK